MKDVSNADTLVVFRKYLAKEILNSKLCCILSNIFITTDLGDTQKKVFGKRVVYLNKILDDLGFWIEAQRYARMHFVYLY